MSHRKEVNWNFKSKSLEINEVWVSDSVFSIALVVMLTVRESSSSVPRNVRSYALKVQWGRQSCLRPHAAQWCLVAAVWTNQRIDVTDILSGVVAQQSCCHSRPLMLFQSDPPAGGCSRLCLAVALLVYACSLLHAGKAMPQFIASGRIPRCPRPAGRYDLTVSPEVSRCLKPPQLLYIWSPQPIFSTEARHPAEETQFSCFQCSDMSPAPARQPAVKSKILLW